jgi:hypothetical protein
MEEEKKGEGFVVKDRRKFTETGESRGTEAEADTKPEAQTRPDEKAEDRKSQEKARQEENMPEMTFSNLVLSLSTSVMFHFGDFPDPVSKKAERNLPAAKQTIDILSMLKDKTKGNLDSDEQNILDSVLFELRMRFVKEKDKG